jgi:aspartyl-tRNA(Asn)/glutamyl-tRNA(Gln) amidotransferase subunit A
MKKPLVTMPANVLGCAAISLPAGFSATGLPLAIQLQGPRLGEATVLRAAHAFQMATDWHRARPEL